MDSLTKEDLLTKLSDAKSLGLSKDEFFYLLDIEDKITKLRERIQFKISESQDTNGGAAPKRPDLIKKLVEAKLRGLTHDEFFYLLSLEIKFMEIKEKESCHTNSDKDDLSKEYHSLAATMHSSLGNSSPAPQAKCSSSSSAPPVDATVQELKSVVSKHNDDIVMALNLTQQLKHKQEEMEAKFNHLEMHLVDFKKKLEQQNSLHQTECGALQQKMSQLVYNQHVYNHQIYNSRISRSSNRPKDLHWDKSLIENHSLKQSAAGEPTTLPRNIPAYRDVNIEKIISPIPMYRDVNMEKIISPIPMYRDVNMEKIISPILKMPLDIRDLVPSIRSIHFDQKEPSASSRPMPINKRELTPFVWPKPKAATSPTMKRNNLTRNIRNTF